jgi:hypothetical protein
MKTYLLAYSLSAVLISQISVFFWGSDPEYVGPVGYFQASTGTNASDRGPTAPNFGICGSAFGLQYTGASITYHAGGILDCWDGTNDFMLLVFFSPESGDPIADGEVVAFDYTYRTAGPTAGTAAAGSEVTVTATYTQSGAGSECEVIPIMVTLDKDDVDQPYTYDDAILGNLSVAASTTYSGDPIVGNVLFNIPRKHICDLG